MDTPEIRALGDLAKEHVTVESMLKGQHQHGAADSLQVLHLEVQAAVHEAQERMETIKREHRDALIRALMHERDLDYTQASLVLYSSAGVTVPMPKKPRTRTPYYRDEGDVFTPEDMRNLKRQVRHFAASVIRGERLAITLRECFYPSLVAARQAAHRHEDIRKTVEDIVRCLADREGREHWKGHWEGVDVPKVYKMRFGRGMGYLIDATDENFDARP